MEYPLVVSLRIDGNETVLVKKLILPHAPREGERITLAGTSSIMRTHIKEIEYHEAAADRPAYTVAHGILELHQYVPCHPEEEDIQDLMSAGWQEVGAIIKAHIREPARRVEEIVFFSA